MLSKRSPYGDSLKDEIKSSENKFPFGKEKSSFKTVTVLLSKRSPYGDFNGFKAGE